MTEQTPTPTAVEIAGERRLRQLIFVIDLLAFLGIGVAALYIWWFWPRGHDVYSDLQQGAGETYLLIWMGIALAGALAALSRKIRMVCFVLSLLLLTECLAQFYYVAVNHRPYHPWARAILDRFEPHPILVAIPRPGTFGSVSHDAMNRRTTINKGKASDAKLVYVFGGSVTYDVAVVDSETWASELSRLLGPHFEVQNYGVQDYSSLEAMLQSLFVFRDVKPACAVYYEGSVDLVLAHLADLSNDYSPDQQAGLRDALAVGYRPGNVANNWLFFQLIDRALQQGPGYGRSVGKVSDQIDTRLSRIFTENMKLITDIARHFGVVPIFIPQTLNYDLMEAHYDWWFPTIPGRAVRPLMHKMNEDLEEAARVSGAVFLNAPLSVKWESGDFADSQHFSAAGSTKFAEAIAPSIAMNCQ